MLLVALNVWYLTMNLIQYSFVLMWDSCVFDIYIYIMYWSSGSFLIVIMRRYLKDIDTYMTKLCLLYNACHLYLHILYICTSLVCNGWYRIFLNFISHLTLTLFCFNHQYKLYNIYWIINVHMFLFDQHLAENNTLTL